MVVENSEKITKKHQKRRDLDEWMDFKKNPNTKYCPRSENEGEKKIGDYFFISVSNGRGSFKGVVDIYSLIGFFLYKKKPIGQKIL